MALCLTGELEIKGTIMSTEFILFEGVISFHSITPAGSPMTCFGYVTTSGRTSSLDMSRWRIQQVFW